MTKASVEVVQGSDTTPLHALLDAGIGYHLLPVLVIDAKEVGTIHDGRHNLLAIATP